jgi:hypothetical protein
MLATVISVILIACHGGPADHFATFAEELKQEGYHVQVYASGPAYKKFEERKIEVVRHFEVEHLSDEEKKSLAVDIAKSCAKASVVLTDVGHGFDIDLQRELKVEAPEAVRLAYYDNPEPYVPGGYSETAAEVMRVAQRVLFSNANLVSAKLEAKPGIEIELPAENRVGIGYYPVQKADELAEMRKTQGIELRKNWFASLQREDKKQKVLVYFGGNNTAYFQEAFPAFTRFLSEAVKKNNLSQYIVVLQQHPGVKQKKREDQTDRKLLEEWIAAAGPRENLPTIILSDQSSEILQGFADGVLVYQTSMGPLLAIAGIPIGQVGHQVFEDILVKSRLAKTAVTSKEFISMIEKMKPQEVSQEKRKEILQELGIKEDWSTRLKNALVSG